MLTGDLNKVSFELDVSTTNLSVSLSSLSLCLSISCLSVCLSHYLSTCLSLCLSVCPSVVRLHVCLSVCPSVCLSVCLAIALCLCVCFFLFLSPTLQGYKQRRAYIATQGPLSETVVDMWRMIWENDCCCIIMLCRTVENGQVGLRSLLSSLLHMNSCILAICLSLCLLSILSFWPAGNQSLFLASEHRRRNDIWKTKGLVESGKY